MSAIMLPFSSHRTGRHPPGGVPGYSSRLWNLGWEPQAGPERTNSSRRRESTTIWSGEKLKKQGFINEAEGRERKPNEGSLFPFFITSQRSMSNAAFAPSFHLLSCHLKCRRFLRLLRLRSHERYRSAWLANYAPKYRSLDAQEVLKSKESELTGTLTCILIPGNAELSARVMSWAGVGGVKEVGRMAPQPVWLLGKFCWD